MKTKLFLAVAAIGIMLASVPLFAHHSFMAEYGGNPVTVKGKLVMFEWVNPHSWAHVEVTGADGKKVIWRGETPPVNLLFRSGWTKPMVEGLVAKGEEVTMSGTPAKDGSNHIFAQSMTILSTGTVMSIQGTPPPADTGK